MAWEKFDRMVMVRMRPDDITLVQAVERDSESGAVRVLHPRMSSEDGSSEEGEWYAVFDSESWWPASDG